MTKDLFHFRDYVLFLKDKLDKTDKSQVVGVHGDYGAGKTTTMNLIKNLYNEDLTGIDNILEFSAWRNYYNNENTVWKALLYELSGKIYDIFEKLEKNEDFSFEGIDNILSDKLLEKLNENKNGFLTKIKGYLFENKEFKKEIDSNKLIIEFVKETCKEIQYNLYQDLKDFNGELKRGESEANKFPYVTFLKSISALVNLDNSGLSDLLKKEEQELKKPKIDSLEVIQRKFDILLGFYNLIEIKGKKIYEDINKEKYYCNIFKQQTPPLIIMIDDLDRILPEKSVEIIEILRIFFEKSKKIHFICAIDIRVIEKGIERKFNQLNNGGDLSRIEFEEYLEKIITIPFDLPAIPLVDFGDDIKGIDSLIEDSIKKGDSVDDKKDIRIIIKEYKELEKYFINNIYNELFIKLKSKLKKDGELNEKYIIKEIEKEKIKEINNVYEGEIIKIFKDSNFNNIIKTGLQANPRKIKRFLDVFEIYLKILLYRTKKKGNLNEYIKNDILKQSEFLAKLLIIKLEWDEIYKEFIRDKFFIGFLEQISRFELGIDLDDDKFEISYNINKFIKKSKVYKLQNLYGMLSIKNYFWEDYKINDEKDGKNMKKGIEEYIKNIYTVYYLFQDIYDEKNENFKYIYKFNLLKYLYEGDEIKVSNYLKIIVSLTDDEKEERIKESEKILNFYKKFLKEKDKKNLDLDDIDNLLFKNENNAKTK